MANKFKNALIPSEFKITEQGVFVTNTDKSSKALPVTRTPVWISELLRDVDSGNWSALVNVITKDGIDTQLLLSYSQIYDLNRETKSLLAKYGCLLIPEAERDFVVFLSGFFDLDLPRRVLVQQLGWHHFNGNDGQPPVHAFVLPQQTLAPLDSPELKDDVFLFHPAGSIVDQIYRSEGSLPEWQAGIAHFANTPLLVFAAATGLAGPFAEQAQASNSLIHLFGNSTTGKTTALQVASSVWGIGIDPNQGRSLVGSWHTTANALEHQLAIHSGMLTCLDELGSAAELGSVVYKIAGGTGKARMSREGPLNAQQQWRTFLLSSGELSIQEKLETDNNRKVKTGELVRAMDIPVDALPTPADRSEEEMRMAIDALKQHCGTCFGTAGPAFIEVILSNFASPEAFGQVLRDDMTEAHRLICERLEADGNLLRAPHKRAITRLALVYVIGSWAAQAEILPFSEDAVQNAVIDVCTAWLSHLPSLSEGERGINVLRDYVIRNMGKILNHDLLDSDAGFIPHDCVAIRHKDMLLFTDEGFNRACGSCSEKSTKTSLQQLGILRTEQGKSKLRVVLKHLGNTRQYYTALDYLRILGDGQDANISEANDNVVQLPTTSSIVPPARRRKVQ